MTKHEISEEIFALLGLDSENIVDAIFKLGQKVIEDDGDDNND